MELKTALHAEQGRRAPTPVSLNGTMTTPSTGTIPSMLGGVDLSRKKAPAPDTIATADHPDRREDGRLTPDRRINHHIRALVADQVRNLSLDQILDFAFTAPQSGLPNKAAYLLAENDPTIAVRFPIHVMCDLDGLKIVNDRHGHSAGDALLGGMGRGITAIMQALPHTEIMAFHISGDEFKLRFRTPEEARSFIDALRKHLASARLELDPGPGTPHRAICNGIHFSAGIALDQQAADAAMYADKAARTAAGTRVTRDGGNVDRWLSSL